MTASQFQANIRLLIADNFLRAIYDYHIENIGEEWLNEITIPDYDFLVHENENA